MTDERYEEFLKRAVSDVEQAWLDQEICNLTESQKAELEMLLYKFFLRFLGQQ